MEQVGVATRSRGVVAVSSAEASGCSARGGTRVEVKEVSEADVMAPTAGGVSTWTSPLTEAPTLRHGKGGSNSLGGGVPRKRPLPSASTAFCSPFVMVAAHVSDLVGVKTSRSCCSRAACAALAAGAPSAPSGSCRASGRMTPDANRPFPSPRKLRWGDSSSRRGDGEFGALFEVRGVPSRWSRRRPLRRGEPLGEEGPPCVSTVHSSCQGSNRRFPLPGRTPRARSSASTTRSVAGRLAVGLLTPTGWSKAPGQKLQSRRWVHAAHIFSWTDVVLTCASESFWAFSRFSRRMSFKSSMKNWSRLWDTWYMSSEWARIFCSMSWSWTDPVPQESRVTKWSMRNCTRCSARFWYSTICSRCLSAVSSFCC
mmetsp:Transcript_82463/g.228780  ORF Transcript_82463/g.228780 Transcript_82463/m.228780 type:complete len:369 (-) Transcript_82463:618-1724(-)